MPQMVALFNGLGGGAAALVALADYHETVGAPGDVEAKIIISILFSAVVGSVSFAGSMIAFGKLQDIVTGNPVTVPGQKVVTGSIFAAILAGCVYLAHGPREPGAARRRRRRLARPRRADGDGDRRRRHARRDLAPECVHRPGNGVDRVRPLEQRAHDSGRLVGASGDLLTQMIGKAMNRSLANMVFGAFGTAGSVALTEGAGGDRKVRSASADDIAIMLASPGASS